MKRFKGNDALSVNSPVKAERKQRGHNVNPPAKRIESSKYKCRSSIPSTDVTSPLVFADVHPTLKFPDFGR